MNPMEKQFSVSGRSVKSKFLSVFFPRVVCLHARTGRQFILCAALWLCGMSGGSPPAAEAVPAYEAQQVLLPPYYYGDILSQFNVDGAMAYSHFDEARQVFAIGVWLPQPLYGRAAGYHELYTYPAVSGVNNGYPFIDNSGNVTFYYAQSYGSWTIGGAGAGGTFPFDSMPFPQWTDSNVIFRDFYPPGLLGWATSDPPPYAAFFAQVVTRDGNSFQPSFNYYYAGLFDGGIHRLAPPEGDFGQIAQLNRQGNAIWVVYDARSGEAGRVLDPDSRRFIAVTPTGAHRINQGYFMNGRGDVSYFDSVVTGAGTGTEIASILLAGPLGPLGPGFHRQADIPGMPPKHFIHAMNSAGVFVAREAAPGLQRYRVVAGGKSAPLGALTTLQPPSGGAIIVTLMNESGMLLAHLVGPNTNSPHYLLTPTLDCDVALSAGQPYRLDEEFDIDVTVRNVAGSPVTEVRVEGDAPGTSGLSVSSWPAFDPLTGPTPAGPVTLAVGATQVFRYHVRATRSGLGELTAKVKGTSSRGTALRAQATTPLEIEQRGDLLLKLAEEPAASFALDNIYQRTAPTGAQNRKVEIVSEEQTRVFEVKVQNDEPRAMTLRLFSLETGSTAIPARYFFGINDITDAIKQTAWTTPELAAGASVIVRVEFGPTDGAIGGETRAALLTLSPLDSSAPCDLVRVEVVNAPPVEVTLRKGSATGLTAQSILAGKGHLDAPLIFKEDPAALRIETVVKRGLVADGVTPLLFEMKVPPENLEGLPDGIEYQLELQLVSGGTLDGAAVDSRLRVLKDGHWRSGARVLTFTATQNVHYAFLMPVASDDVQFSGGATELKLRLRFTQPTTGVVVTDKTVLLRKPPIVLVHGYNTGGEWGETFTTILATARGQDFIRTIRYGQEPGGAANTAKLNTVLPFGQLVPILDLELRNTMIEIAEAGWAFTRFDYVGHSQGGVLGRMLCSQNGNRAMPLPFRNAENFYRGRFHRVVTVGSPHNGTRIVRYMLELRARLNLDPVDPAFNLGIPSAVAGFLVFNGTAQDKFDPFGQPIRLLHSPEPTAPWYPDLEAKFHLVQTTVNSGQPPSIASFSPADVALGFLVNGADVLPRGSDGVVDFDSMTATTPEAGQSPPANSYRMPDSLQIAHALVIAGGVNIFAGDEGQVDSLPVAHHVIHALDQNSLVPASDRVFGPFRLAIPLPQSVADQIQAAALAVTSGVLDVIHEVAAAGLRAAAGPAQLGDGAEKTFEFNPPNGETLAGPVQWSVERYGENGITTTGLTLQPVPGNPARVNVVLAPSTCGDVVLYGTARTLSGAVFIAAPKVIWSVEPAAGIYSLSDIAIRPRAGDYPAGTTIEPQLWETYYPNEGGDIFQLQRWITPQAFQVVSSDLSVVNVSNPLLWHMVNPGRTYVWVTWKELLTRVAFSVYSQDSNGVDDDGDGLANADEANVPNRNGGPLHGDGNGDGIPDNIQNSVASLRAPNGQWLTLQAPATGLHGVTLATAPSDPGALPGHHAFDYGFLTFGQYLSNPGASAVFTLFLPANHDITTVWAFGPTPGDTTSHWYEFLYDGQTGAEILTNRIILHLTDGARGDGDGAADANIGGVILGLARSLPDPPVLSIAPGSPGEHTITWPAVFPNAARTYLESTDALTPSTRWRFVPDVPTQVGGENKLINTNAGPAQFYRLLGQ